MSRTGCSTDYKCLNETFRFGLSLDGTWLFKGCSYSDICHWLREAVQAQINVWSLLSHAAAFPSCMFKCSLWRCPGSDSAALWEVNAMQALLTPVFLQMIWQIAWEFSPNKWWANSGNLFTVHCVSRGGTCSLQAHVKNWAARELSMMLLRVEMLCKPSYSVLRNRQKSST